MPKRIQLPDDFYKHDFKQLAKIEKHPRTRIRFIGLSHIQNGKSGEKNDYYTLFIVLLFFEFCITQKTQSFDWVFCVAVKQWVRHYKDEGIDGLKEKKSSGRPSKARNQNHSWILFGIVLLVKKMIIIHYLWYCCFLNLV
jgi:hypothetical protein